MNLPVMYNKLTPKKRRQVRLEYIERQGGTCFFCKESLDGDPPSGVTAKEVSWYLFPPNFLKAPIHLQHDHDTGLTEGAVHALCNAVWWQYHGR